MKKDCKPNCKPTAQHSLAQGLTKEDHRLGNAKLEHTFSHQAAQASMRITELENRGTGNRTEGSNPSVSAKKRRKLLITTDSPNRRYP